MARVPRVRQDLSRTTCASVGSAQQNQLSLRCGRSSLICAIVDGRRTCGCAQRGVGGSGGRTGVGAGFHDRRELLLERVDGRVGRVPRVRETIVVPRAEMGREVGMVEEQRAARQEQADRELHRVDAADQIVLVHEVEQRDHVVDASSTA